MLNRIILIGRLTADPELRYTPSGIPVAGMRLAVDRPFTSSSGERQTDFINLVAWRQNAEFAANYLGKGRLVAVEGRLEIRQWTTKDGQRRQTAEVVADRLQALDRAREPAATTDEAGDAVASEAQPSEEAQSSEEAESDQTPEEEGPWADQ